MELEKFCGLCKSWRWCGKATCHNAPRFAEVVHLPPIKAIRPSPVIVTAPVQTERKARVARKAPESEAGAAMAELRNEAIQQTAFDRLAYQRAYMRNYMRKKRAKDKKP